MHLFSYNISSEGARMATTISEEEKLSRRDLSCVEIFDSCKIIFLFLFIKKITMNSIIKSILFFLVISIGTNSCSIEKRIYQSGYNTTWFKTNTDKSKRVDAAQDARNKEVKSTFNKTPINSAPEIAPQHEKPNSAFTTASLDKCIFSNPHRIEKPFVLHTLKTNDFLANLSKKTSMPDSGFQLKDPQKPEKRKYPNPETLLILGSVLFSLGATAFRYINIIGGVGLLGLPMMLIGLILFLASGKAMKPILFTSSPSDNQAQFVDEVYLKDGSIINGMIIEQIPNVSLKIQSRDGGVLEYKMEDVSKIKKK